MMTPPFALSLMTMQKITPFLWFNGDAEEAAAFYASVFRDSKTVRITRYPKDAPGPEGTAMTVRFEIHGQEFIALNGGPGFPFTQAVSFVVNCETQEEVDRLWVELSAGGKTVCCGWLRDRFGLSWQIVPAEVLRMIQDADPAKAAAAVRAVWGMEKIDIAAVRRAYAAA